MVCFRSSPYADKEPEMAKYTPNTSNIIQILIAAVITMVVLDLLHVWG